MATPTVSRITQSVMPLLRKANVPSSRSGVNDMKQIKQMVFQEAKPTYAQKAAPLAPAADGLDQTPHPLAKNIIAMRLYAKSGRCH